MTNLRPNYEDRLENIFLNVHLERTQSQKEEDSENILLVLNLLILKLEREVNADRKTESKQLLAGILRIIEVFRQQD